VYLVNRDPPFKGGSPAICAFRGKKELSLREHICSEYGYSTTRNIASTQIIKQRGETVISRMVSNLQNRDLELIEVPSDGGDSNIAGLCNAEISIRESGSIAS
jgi:hypothetical protein